MIKDNATTFTLPADDLKWLVDGVTVAASRGDISPVITGVHWVVSGDEVRLIATDRYRVHTAILPVSGAPAPAEFTAPLGLMVWLQRNARAFRKEWPSPSTGPVRVTFVPDTGVITFEVLTPNESVSLKMSGASAQGVYPPVLRLFEAARKAEPWTAAIALNPKFVGDVGKLGKAMHAAPRMSLTVGGREGVPGPALFTYAEEGREPFAEALIQPNLLRR